MGAFSKAGRFWLLSVWSSAAAMGLALAQDNSAPLEGAAYRDAETAYSSYAKSDFQNAANKARDAIVSRPDVVRLRLLLIDSLFAAGQIAEAEQEAIKASQLFSDPELTTRLKSIRDQVALTTAGDAYKALAAGNPIAAVQSAQRAVQTAPDNLSYRLLLLNSHLVSNNLTEALSTANGAVARDRSAYAPLVWRGYLNQRLGNRPAAVADFNAATALAGLTEVDQKNIRLIAADSALAAGDVAGVVQLLKDYPRTDPEIQIRLGDAEGVLARKGTLLNSVKDVAPPVQNCQPAGAIIVCTLQAPVAQSRFLPAPDKTVLASDAANRAYQAERRKDYATAIDEARKALAVDQGSLPNRLLLVNLYLAAGRPADAEVEATSTIKNGSGNAELFAQRGYARNQLKNYKGAISDWEEALRRGLPQGQANNVRLSLVDVALSAKQPARALSVLQHLGTSSYDTVIRRAYAFEALDRKVEAAAAFNLAARLAPSDLQRDAALRSQINLMAAIGQKAQARAMLHQAISNGQLRTIRAADIGYLAAQVGDDPLALASFDQARSEQSLPAIAHFDAGYAAKRNFENQKAIAYLKRGLDLWSEGRFEFDQQQLFGVRRQLADLSRVWGINTSVSYGKAGAAPNPFALPTSSYTAQVGSEIYYRPEGFGYRDGAIFDVFARVFDTLYDQSGGPTGSQTLQSMVGARWKPFGEHNLVLEIDKLFRSGSAARNDTLLRVAYSYTDGTDLRVDTNSWFTAIFYTEADHFFEHTQTVLQADGRIGQSFRLGALSPNLVAFPHAVVAANYDDSFANRQAYSAGLGTSLRYWFGETRYLAPTSYLELTMQYRFRIAGDSRAEGLFAQALVNY